MEQLSSPIFIAFAIAWLMEFYLFGIQRALAKVAIQNNAPWKEVRKNLMPNWFLIVWFFTGAKYVLLITMFFILNWKIALISMVSSLILSIIIPIPYKLLYAKFFHNRINEISRTDFEVGNQYSKMLDNTRF